MLSITSLSSLAASTDIAVTVSISDETWRRTGGWGGRVLTAGSDRIGKTLPADFECRYPAEMSHNLPSESASTAPKEIIGKYCIFGSGEYLYRYDTV